MINNTVFSAPDLFPKDKESILILRKRAEQLSKGKIKEEKNETTTYIRFRLGKHEYYGIAFHSVKEVMYNSGLTKLPYTPSYIAGVINRLGYLLAVVDLSQFFKIQYPYAMDNKYIIVIETNGVTVGILADNIEGSDDYDLTSLDSALPSDNLMRLDYVVGLHRGTTTILNIKEIVSKINRELNQHPVSS